MECICSVIMKYILHKALLCLLYVIPICTCMYILILYIFRMITRPNICGLSHKRENKIYFQLFLELWVDFVIQWFASTTLSISKLQ